MLKKRTREPVQKYLNVQNQYFTPGKAVLFLLLYPFICFSQTPAAPPPAVHRPSPAVQQDTQKLKIETAILVEYFVKGERTLQKLSGNVRMRQENTLVYCDTAILDMDVAILKEASASNRTIR